MSHRLLNSGACSLNSFLILILNLLGDSTKSEENRNSIAKFYFRIATEIEFCVGRFSIGLFANETQLRKAGDCPRITFFPQNRNAIEKVLRVIHLTVLYNLHNLSFRECGESFCLDSFDGLDVHYTFEQRAER